MCCSLYSAAGAAKLWSYANHLRTETLGVDVWVFESHEASSSWRLQYYHVAHVASGRLVATTVQTPQNPSPPIETTARSAVGIAAHAWCKLQAISLCEAVLGVALEPITFTHVGICVIGVVVLHVGSLTHMTHNVVNNEADSNTESLHLINITSRRTSDSKRY